MANPNNALKHARRVNEQVDEYATSEYFAAHQMASCWRLGMRFNDVATHKHYPAPEYTVRVSRRVDYYRPTRDGRTSARVVYTVRAYRRASK